MAPHYAGDAFLGHGGVRTLGRRWRLTAAAPRTGKGCCPGSREGGQRDGHELGPKYMGGRHPPLEGLPWDHRAGLHLHPALAASCPSCLGGPSLRSGERGPEAASGLQTEVMSYQPSRLRGTKLITPRMPTGAGARTSVSSPLGVWRAAVSPVRPISGHHVTHFRGSCLEEMGHPPREVGAARAGSGPPG